MVTMSDTLIRDHRQLVRLTLAAVVFVLVLAALVMLRSFIFALVLGALLMLQSCASEQEIASLSWGGVRACSNRPRLVSKTRSFGGSSAAGT
ncbi:MAG: hypothetical protein OEW25_07835 [Nitrospira sp.]|nr:hypothetical protein [Nitrospira sp.]